MIFFTYGQFLLKIEKKKIWLKEIENEFYELNEHPSTSMYINIRNYYLKITKKKNSIFKRIKVHFFLLWFSELNYITFVFMFVFFLQICYVKWNQIKSITNVQLQIHFEIFTSTTKTEKDNKKLYDTGQQFIFRSFLDPSILSLSYKWNVDRRVFCFSNSFSCLAGFTLRLVISYFCSVFVLLLVLACLIRRNLEFQNFRIKN